MSKSKKNCDPGQIGRKAHNRKAPHSSKSVKVPSTCVTSKNLTYQKFVSRELPKLRKKYPELKQTDYMKLAAKEWNKYKKENAIGTGSKTASKTASKTTKTKSMPKIKIASVSKPAKRKTGSKTAKQKPSKRSSKNN